MVASDFFSGPKIFLSFLICMSTLVVSLYRTLNGWRIWIMFPTAVWHSNMNKKLTSIYWNQSKTPWKNTSTKKKAQSQSRPQNPFRPKWLARLKKILFTLVLITLWKEPPDLLWTLPHLTILDLTFAQPLISIQSARFLWLTVMLVWASVTNFFLEAIFVRFRKYLFEG